MDFAEESKMSFAHVADAAPRSILEQDSCDEYSICYAPTQTKGAVHADQTNTDVSYEAWNARNEAYEDAGHEWGEGSNAAAAIEALKECWSV